MSLLVVLMMAMVAPEGVAVVAHPAGDQTAQSAATAARTALRGQALSAAKIDERMRGQVGTSLSDALFDAKLAAMDAAFAAGNSDGFATVVDRTCAELSADEAYNPAKFVRLEAARILAAQRLLGLAGPAEKGKGDTKLGLRAKAVLRDAVRANPTLTLATDQYPPKLRTLLSAALEDVRRGPQATLTATGVAGVEVFVEGRSVGKAPVVVPLAAGKHRVWGELSGARSRIRVMTVAADEHVDYVADPAFDASLKPTDGTAGPGITADAGVLTAAYLSKLRSMLGADVLVMGSAQGDNAALLAMFSSQSRTERIAVRSDEVAATAATLATVVVEQRATTGLEVDNDRLPPSFFAHASIYASPADAAAVAAEDAEPFPWAVVGGVAAGVVVVTGGAVGAILYLNRPAVVKVGQSYCIAGGACP